MKIVQKYVKHTGMAAFFVFLLLTFLIGCEEKETAEMIENQIKEFEASLPVEKKQLIKSEIVGRSDRNIKPGAIYYNIYDSLLYITDLNNSKVVIFDRDLQYKSEFGGYGQGPAEFLQPADIYVLRNGKIIVTDLFSQKLKIFDKNFNLTYEKRFLGGSGGIFQVRADYKDRIYLNLPKPSNKHLFIVINDRGDSITTFGDLLLPNYDRELTLTAENKIYFAIDENNDIYCTFRDTPLLRKYNNNFQLEYEIKLDTIPYIKKQYARWKEIRKGKKSSYTEKNYVKGLYVNVDYIFIVFWNPRYEFPMLAFDKHTGKIEKIYDFINDDKKVKVILTAYNFQSIDAIYAISEGMYGGLFNKYIK